MNISEKILSMSSTMSKKHSAIGKYILDNICDVALMNAPRIARGAGVSEATLTRFVYALGFNNFSEFLTELRIETINNNSMQFRQEPPLDPNIPVYHRIFEMEMGLMQETLNNLDPEVFDKTVDMLFDSKKLFLVGGPTHAPIAQYGANFIRDFRDDVYVISHIDLVFLAQLDSANANSVALIFSYPRYSKETQRIAQTLFDKGVQIVGITDSKLSPLASLAKYMIITPQKYVILADSYSPVVTLLHAFMVGMYNKHPDKIKAKLEEYERNVLATDMFIYKDYNFANKL